MRDWLITHWDEIVTGLGAGSGGTFFTKKWIDRRQDKKLKEHAERITKLERDLEKNAINDTNFKEQFFEHKAIIKDRLDKIDAGQERLHNDLQSLIMKFIQ